MAMRRIASLLNGWATVSADVVATEDNGAPNLQTIGLLVLSTQSGEQLIIRGGSYGGNFSVDIIPASDEAKSSNLGGMRNESEQRARPRHPLVDLFDTLAGVKKPIPKPGDSAAAKSFFGFMDELAKQVDAEEKADDALRKRVEAGEDFFWRCDCGTFNSVHFSGDGKGNRRGMRGKFFCTGCHNPKPSEFVLYEKPSHASDFRPLRKTADCDCEKCERERRAEMARQEATERERVRNAGRDASDNPEAGREARPSRKDAPGDAVDSTGGVPAAAGAGGEMPQF